KRGQSIVLPLRPTIFHSDVLTLDVAGFGQALTEGSHKASPRPGWTPVEDTDHRNRPLLRARRDGPKKRRHGRTAEQRDEVAPSHVGHGLPLRNPERPAYCVLKLPWKRRQVLGPDLNPSESARVRVARLSDRSNRRVVPGSRPLRAERDTDLGFTRDRRSDA